MDELRAEAGRKRLTDDQINQVADFLEGRSYHLQDRLAERDIEVKQLQGRISELLRINNELEERARAAERALLQMQNAALKSSSCRGESASCWPCCRCITLR
jgi:hypothetical protein